MGTQTPWGVSDWSERIAPGIMRYDTPSHGGYHLSPTRMREVPAVFLTAGYGVDKGWFEEDCCWAFVALTFPEYFSPDACHQAYRTVQVFYPNIFQDVEAQEFLHPWA